MNPSLINALMQRRFTFGYAWCPEPLGFSLGVLAESAIAEFDSQCGHVTRTMRIASLTIGLLWLKLEFGFRFWMVDAEAT